MATLLTTSSGRDDGNTYPQLVPLLAGLFGGIAFLCLCGLIWCIVRRRKHRAPVIPYSLHTLPRSTVPPGHDDEDAAAGMQPGVKRPKPAKLGTHGRGVGYGFNPILKEPFGGGGGLESGSGPVAARRLGAVYG